MLGKIRYILFEVLEPRILLSVDGLLNTIIPHHEQNISLDNMQEFVLYTEVLDTDEQYQEQISLEMVQSDTPNTEAYEPLLTLLPDDNNTNEQSSNTDLSVGNIGSAQTLDILAALSNDYYEDMEGNVSTTEKGGTPIYENDAEISVEGNTSIEIRGPPSAETGLDNMISPCLENKGPRVDFAILDVYSADVQPRGKLNLSGQFFDESAANELNGRIIYVDIHANGSNNGTSWADAYKSLQNALAAALSGDQIWVADGTYKPGAGDRTVAFWLENGVGIYGGFAGGETSLDQRDWQMNLTVLSGDLNGDDSVVGNAENSYHVVISSGNDNTAVLDGFIITAGNANGSNPHCYGGGMLNVQGSPNLVRCNFINNTADVGGGMFNYENSSPSITNCSFTENWADYGAGMYNINGSNPELRNCRFIENQTWHYSDKHCRGAGIYNSGSSIVLRNCTFERNVATDKGYPLTITRQGGAIYNYDTHVNLYGCNFEENFANYMGGAISSEGSSSVTATNCKFSKNKTGKMTAYPYCRGGAIAGGDLNLTNCEFVRNSSDKGGAVDAGGGSELNNCIFSMNSAVEGGAIFSAGLNLTNCTLVKNGASRGGAIYHFGNPVLSNCILWGNSAGQIYTDGGAPVINYCCIEGWTGSLGGVGNIADDPMFVRWPDDGGDGWGDNTATININEGLNDDYGTFHLLPGSPCIDAGDNAVVPPDTTDLDGDSDMTEPIPWDLDGDERFADDPDSSDTGSGTPPIVDIGAYECPKQGFLLSTEFLTISEGGTATFTVALRLEPAGDFEVQVKEVTVPDEPEPGEYEPGYPWADILVESGALLVFNPSNYSVPQTVTLRAAEDNDDYFHGIGIVEVTAPGVVTGKVNVIEDDNEPYPNIILVDADATGANDGSSWEDAYTALQDALHKAVSVGLLINHIRFTDFEIRVAQGVYWPDKNRDHPDGTGNREASFNLLAGVPLRGGFAGFGEPEPDARDVDLYETILSGDLDGNDVGEQNDPSRSENSYHVVVGTANTIGPTAILEGFTISGGNANADSGDYWSGGGLYLKRKAIIKNCKFQHNRASGSSGGGGGVYCNSAMTITVTDCNFIQNWVLNSSSDGGGAIANCGLNLKISNCDFNNNSASGSSGGAVYNSIGSLTIGNCTFSSNDSSDNGGAICTYSSNSTITDCNFTGNSADSGGGVYGGNGTVINCTFSNNSAMNGGGMVNAGSVINCTFMGNSAISDGLTLNTGRGGAIFNTEGSSAIVNCLFVGNYAAAYDQSNSGEGGALYDFSGEPVLINCTVVANTATHSGSGMSGNSTVTNCIFWGNTAPSGSQMKGSTITVTYSDVQGGWPGDGNINSDPLFVDVDGADDVVGTKDDDLRLLPWSPCIDAGDNSAVPIGIITDLDGRSRFIDDPLTFDTGIGTPPIVDMGAYEFHYGEGPLYGICHGPFREGQSPELGIFPTEEQLKQDISIISGVAEAERTYGVDNVLGKIPEICNQYDVDCYVGGWISGDPSFDQGTISELICIAGQSYDTTKALIVGSEAFLFNRVTEQELIEFINQVDIATDVLVTTAEPWHLWLVHPDLANAVDFISIHVHPYWEQIHIDSAAQYVIDKYNLVKQAYPEKEVIIMETGWPSAGGVLGQAVPSETNQEKFLRDFIPLAEEGQVRYFIFEAFDEPWKKKYSEVEGHWGLYYEDRTLKPDIETILYPIDIESPAVVSLSPPDDATGVVVDTNLVITFSEDVQKGMGSVVIKKFNDDTVVETINVDSTAVTMSGSQATIDASLDLAESTSYYVQIDSGAFEDLSSNDFVGIGDKTTWNFSTAAAPLQVVLLEVEAYGIVAHFNRQVDPEVLNLYDTEAGIYGPADFTVVGDSVGQVAGSLICIEDGTIVSFIKTGGPLEPDTYTITLRSGADAFKDTEGHLLDGDDDGVEGGDYVTTVSVEPATARLLSIPDFTRGPGQNVNVPAADSGIPLTISDGGGVLSVNFTFDYEPALLTVTGLSLASGLPVGWELDYDFVTPGHVPVTILGATPLSAGQIRLVEINALVPEYAPYKTAGTLSLSNVQINDGSIASRADSAVQVAAYFGDTTGNGTYSGLDAAYIARVSVGLDGGFSAYRLIDPVIIADVTGNGALSGLDAAYVARKAVGLEQPQIPDLPDPLPVIIAGGQDPLLSIPEPLVTAKRGATITVPILVDDATISTLLAWKHNDKADISLAGRLVELVNLEIAVLSNDSYRNIIEGKASTIKKDDTSQIHVNYNEIGIEETTSIGVGGFHWIRLILKTQYVPAMKARDRELIGLTLVEYLEQVRLNITLNLSRLYLVLRGGQPEF